jgi:hypothetical protein
LAHLWRRHDLWARRAWTGGDDVEAALVEHLLAELDVGALEADHQRDLEPTSFTAVITPVAMVSHFMMPPKMLTRIPFTWGRG